MHLPKHQLAMTVLMTPDMANFSGNVHGGTILKLLDQVAYACASRYASQYVVTLSVDQVMFRQPIHVGELVTFLASVNYTGNTSMEIGVKVLAESIRDQVIRHANSTFSTISSHLRRAVSDLKKVLDAEGENYQAFSAENRETVFSSVKFAQLIKAMIDTPILDQDGNLVLSTEKRLQEIKGSLA